MLRRTAVAVLIMSAVLFAAGAANAQQYGTPSVGGSDTTPDKGQTITVSGSGCPAGSQVNFLFDGQPNGGTTADQNGNFSGPFTVPSNASAGTHTVAATCGAQVLAFEIRVNPPAVVGAGIPRTGSSSTVPLASIALAVLSVGGLFVLFARRRRVSHQPA